MTLGPIEMVVLEFPESRFTGDILPEIRSVVERGIVRIVDALIVRKAADGTVIVVEIDELDGELAALTGDVANQLDLVSAEDVDELAASISAGGTAAVIVFEHTWMLGIRQAIVASGGILVEDLHIPAAVVDEVVAAIETI